METYITSDQHFSHIGMTKFRDSKNNLIRNFESVEAMNSYMIDKWNSTVSPTDTVYMLGDIVLKLRHLDIVRQLNGNIRLILGNHDVYGVDVYREYFTQIYSVKYMHAYNLMLSHIPLHLGSIKENAVNVHGHIHNKIITKNNLCEESDWSNQHHKYYNACVEHHDFTPININVITEYVKQSHMISNTQ